MKTPAVPAETRLRALGALGMTRMFGLMRSSIPALAAEAGVELHDVRLALGTLWSWPHTERYGPGKLPLRSVSRSLRVCAPLSHTRWLRIDACSGAYVGAFDVRARGYSRDNERKHLWIAAPLDLTLSLGSTWLRSELAVGAVFSARRPDFSVLGLGTAYHAWPVSPTVALRLLALAPR